MMTISRQKPLALLAVIAATGLSCSDDSGRPTDSGAKKDSGQPVDTRSSSEQGSSAHDGTTDRGRFEAGQHTEGGAKADTGGKTTLCASYETVVSAGSFFTQFAGTYEAKAATTACAISPSPFTNGQKYNFTVLDSAKSITFKTDGADKVYTWDDKDGDIVCMHTSQKFYHLDLYDAAYSTKKIAVRLLTDVTPKLTMAMVEGCVLSGATKQ